MNRVVSHRLQALLVGMYFVSSECIRFFINSDTDVNDCPRMSLSAGKFSYMESFIEMQEVHDMN